MKTFSPNTRFTRRDFLKLALAAGTTATIMPVLEACSRVPSPTPVEPLPLPTATGTTILPVNTAAVATSTEPVAVNIDQFIDESVRRLFQRDPEAVTMNGLSGLLGVRNDRLTDVSDEYIRETQRIQAEIHQQLKAVDPSPFTPPQALDAAVFGWYLDDLVRGFPFMYNDYLVLPYVNGLVWNLNYLFTEAHPFTDSWDAEDYISRLRQLDTRLDQVLDGLERHQEYGVVIPGIIIPSLIDQLSQFTVSARSNPFFTTFLNKTGGISSLDSADRMSLVDQAEASVKENVIPAYQSMVDTYRRLQQVAPDDVGIWQYPNGEAYYAHLLSHYTTTDLSAEQIHRLGQENVERIQGEMREAFGKLGYPSNDGISSLMDRLVEDSGYISGAEAESAYRSAIELAKGFLDQAFDWQLKDEIEVVGGTEGNYFSPAPRDGSRPPVFRALTASRQPSFRIKDIAFHEAVPGHGFQFDVARQLNPALFREAVSFDAYIEGWALYAEWLMWELGVFDDDPAGNLGRLDLELLRAMRLVVDTGIHTKKWSWSQSVQYMKNTSGASHEEEVFRYIMWPGQVTSYYTGYLRILELRQKAKDRLGSTFDLKAFHHTVLGSGQMPLSLLEQQVEATLA